MKKKLVTAICLFALMLSATTVFVMVNAYNERKDTQQKSVEKKKSREIQIGEYSYHMEPSDPNYDIEADLKKKEEMEIAWLTYEYDKNPDYYCETVLQQYQSQWESSSELYKNGWRNDWIATQKLTEEEKKKDYISGTYIGSGSFRRYIGFINGEYSLDLPRVSYDKVKQYESVFLAETKGMTIQEKISYSFVCNAFIYTVPDMEYGSGRTYNIYSLDDSLTKFIVFNIGMIDGPKYFELDETRRNVITKEYMWPEARKEFIDWMIAEEKFEALKEGENDLDKMADRILSFFRF